MIKPSSIGSNTVLEDFTTVDASLPSGTEGHWFMSTPETAFETTKRVFAARFSPKSDSRGDPTFKVGTAEIVTYQASRTTPANLDELMALPMEHAMLKQSNSFSTSFRW